MTAIKKGTAMKDKTKRAGGGAPPPPGTYPESTDVGLSTQDNVFGTAGFNYLAIQSGLSCASLTISTIMDGNTGANVAPYTGTDLEVADYLATVVQSHTPTGFPATPISGEITLNIANNGSVTLLDIGVSVYNTANERFGGGSVATLSVFHDALNLVGNHQLIHQTNLPIVYPASAYQLQAQQTGGAIALDNPPAVATGQLIFEVRWANIATKRGSGQHETDRAANPTSQFTGSTYLGVIIN